MVSELLQLAIAHMRRRVDYRRIHDMLRPEYPDPSSGAREVNKKGSYTGRVANAMQCQSL